jgi:hypothetical protein
VVVVSRGLVGVVEVGTANVEGGKEDGEDVDKSGMGVEDEGVARVEEDGGGGGMRVDDVELLEEGPGDVGELVEGAVVGEDVRLLVDMGLDDKIGGLDELEDEDSDIQQLGMAWTPYQRVSEREPSMPPIYSVPGHF